MEQFEKLRRLNNLLFDNYQDIYTELMTIILEDEKEEIKKQNLEKLENVLGISINQLRELLK